MAKSSVLRLGAAFRTQVEDLLAEGATIDEITTAVNAALAAEGRDDRVSRSAVGRVTKSMAETLQAKRRADQIVAALAEAGPAGGGLDGRLELLRTLLVDAAVRMVEDDDSVANVSELKDVAGAMLNVEKTGHLADLRRERERARQQAGDRGERAARGQGLSAAGAAAIRSAIEGAQ